MCLGAKYNLQRIGDYRAYFEVCEISIAQLVFTVLAECIEVFTHLLQVSKINGEGRVLSVGFQKRKAIAFNYNSHEIRAEGRNTSLAGGLITVTGIDTSLSKFLESFTNDQIKTDRMRHIIKVRLRRFIATINYE